jgi:hypothetical protein
MWTSTWNIIVVAGYGVWSQVSKFDFKEENGVVIW